MRRVLLAAVLFVLGACGGDSEEQPAASSDVAVAVKDFTFAPKEIRVASGGTVTWTNEDEFDHSVVIDDLEVDSANFGPQTAPVTYKQRFTKAGTYPYICGVHNSMTGTVVVTE